MRLTFILLAAITGVYLMVLAFIFVSQDRLFSNSPSELRYTPDDYGLSPEDIWVETSDGVNLHGQFFPNERAELTVIYAYDNRGKIGAGIGMAEILLNSGASVFMYHHRGTGQSGGSFSEEGFYRDIEAVVRKLRSEKGYDENDMVIYGRAVGGAVAAFAATQFNLRGLVLDSAFLNYQAMFRDRYPFVPSGLAKYEFPADRFLGEVQELPVMIMHSPDDEVAGFHHGKGLYDILDQPKMLIELNGGHIESFMVSREIIEQSWAFYIATLCSRCRMYMN
ncbi:MAG: alpha/beta hydrolase [Balneolaceae bacterium]|nr:MAG: alpha/beta hydrolase [Balneolaceae bacterium]